MDESRPNLTVVTGGLGFIGSRLLRSLLQKDSPQSLLAVDHPFQEKKRANRSLTASVALLDHQAFLDALASGALHPETIIHLGASAAPASADHDGLAENNLEYSRILWNWCAEHQARFFYASSAATYGQGAFGFDDEAALQSLNPQTPYGILKHAFDLWVEEQACSSNPTPIQWIGLKLFNVFGPGESHKEGRASFVYQAFQEIKRTGKVQLYEPGEQARDFIHVSQVVDIIQQFLNKPAINGIFNVGTGRATGLKTVAEMVFVAMNLTPVIDIIPLPHKMRSGYQQLTQATMTKAAKAGIQVPELSLEKAIADYISYLLCRNPA
jgi:ADP-L-glycero-D-manno-heptose 6-epimerase